MPQVVGVRFRYSKTLWFDPNGTEPAVGDMVIASTERGTELGECVQAPFEVAESELPAALKPVERIAEAEDLEYALELSEKEKDALPVFRELIEKNEVDMKPADVEFLFGGEKIIFYFSAEERVDFRSLVRDLAAHFHTRIDMRQVGVRDEARMIGGIGHCGEVLCCARLGGEFAPVSIKMAKDQGLPLNPTKISGLCGRLMCCLRYEVDAYKDFTKRAPRKGAVVETPRGDGKVIELNALKELVKLRFQSEDNHSPGDILSVGLNRMCCAKGKGCPCSISREAFDEIEAENEQARDLVLSANGLSYKSLTSTQGTESAIDNGSTTAARPAHGLHEDKGSKKKPKADNQRRNRRRGGARNKPKGGDTPVGTDAHNRGPSRTKPAGSAKPKPAADKPKPPEGRIPRRRRR
jgi:cell fate regulator YaaT (PSP1 superfamily)